MSWEDLQAASGAKVTLCKITDPWSPWNESLKLFPFVFASRRSSTKTGRQPRRSVHRLLPLRSLGPGPEPREQTDRPETVPVLRLQRLPERPPAAGQAPAGPAPQRVSPAGPRTVWGPDRAPFRLLIAWKRYLVRRLRGMARMSNFCQMYEGCKFQLSSETLLCPKSVLVKVPVSIH